MPALALLVALSAGACRVNVQGDSVNTGEGGESDPGSIEGGSGGQGGRGGRGGRGGQAGQPGQPGQPGQSAGESLYVRGSGNVITETRPVSGFDSVSFRGSAQVFIDQNGRESLSLEAEHNLMAHLSSEVSGRRLILGVKPNVTLESTKPIIFRLSVKDLKEIEASGSGDIEAKNLNGDSLAIGGIGSFDMNLQGRVTRETINLSGSGSVDAERLDSSAASVDISGSGDVVVRASERLIVRISGSGSVEYAGDPKVTQTVSGSGSVQKR